MRRILVCLLLVVSTVTASAQPGNTPYVPPPYTYQPQPQPQALTPEEIEILDDGPVSEGAHVVGALSALFVGFGTGQAIQGRWMEKGWIFTAGELGAYILVLTSIPHFGAANCELDCEDEFGDSEDHDTRLAFAAMAWIGFRIWGFADSISGPSAKNRRYRQVRAKVGYPYYATPFVTPAAHGDGATAGVTIRF